MTPPAGPPPPAAGGSTRLRSVTTVRSLVRRFPIPFLAVAGLAAGAVLTLPGSRPDIGDLVWTATLVLGGIPIVYHTLRGVAGGRYSADIIAAAAIVAAIALDQAFAGVVIVIMQSGGEALEQYALHRATSSLEELLKLAPRVAHRRSADQVLEVAVDDVRPGDRLVIRTGDVVPVDGRVEGSPATLDEAAVTGESLPRERPPGDEVLSGSINVGPSFDLLALRPSGKSQYARIVALVRSAGSEKPAIQRLADRYAIGFTPAAFALALFAGLYTRDPVSSLAVLVVATPCPLILATPIAVLGGINRAADRGLVVKSGAAIEELGRTRAVLFDKTGTITGGRPSLDRIVSVRGRPESDLLRWAGALEAHSSHPLARAVVSAAQERGSPPAGVTDPFEVPGSGMLGTLEGHRVVVGSRELCDRECREGTGAVRAVLEREGDGSGHLVSYVVVDGVAEGALLFSDHLRPEVPGFIARLPSLGVVRIALLTGDTPENARRLAGQAGIPEYFAGLKPEEKVERVGRTRRSVGPTVMVGDGINDAPALASASVGIAMGAHGAGVSVEAADAVILPDDVSRVADGIVIGQRMLRIARQGIVLGLGASLVLMVIASLGAIPPAEGAVLQEVIDVAVIGNALRVRFAPTPPLSIPPLLGCSPHPR